MSNLHKKNESMSKIPISENYPHFLYRAIKNPIKAAKAFLPQQMPSIIWLETTNRCNLRCRSCSKFYKHYDSKTDMSMDLFNKVLNQVATHAECIILTGIGEALYHQEAKIIFEQLMKHKHYRVEFTTNGKLMDEDWIQLLSKLRCHVTFSIDGTNESTHQYNRLGSDLENIKSALHKIRKMELASTNPGQFLFKRRINFVIMKNNMHQMPDMVHWAKQYGIELLIFILMNNWGFPEDFWREQNPLNFRDELIFLLKKTRALADQSQIALIIPTVSPINKTNSSSDQNNIIVPKKRFNPLSYFKPSLATDYPRFEDRFCDIPFKGLYVRADGKTSFCCASWHVELGDANVHNIKEIWNSLRYRIPRVAMSVGSHTSFCRICDLPYGLAKGNPRDNQ
jgi:MoaA/NifB/PqqE/SkfB family radical SAM enzyme